MAVTNPHSHEDEPRAFTDTLYAELKSLAARAFAGERPGHTLQPTAVVNEACMRLMSSGLPDLPREQQLAIAGRVLKRVLIDHARARGADKRGGGTAPMRLDLAGDALVNDATPVDFERIRTALDRLRTLNARQAEVIDLRIFTGMTMDQIASVLGVPKRAAENDWTVARAWLRRELATSMAGRGG